METPSNNTMQGYNSPFNLILLSQMLKSLKFFKGLNMILTQKIAFKFGGLPLAYLRPQQTRNTQLVSLSMEETEQLLTITAYSQSIQQLRKNNLAESLLYLKFSLNQSRQKFPYSINLQNCLMNRISIILKLLNKTKDFEETLELIYLTAISISGPKHLNSIKSLINYMIALTVYNPHKCNNVLEYLRQKGQTSDYLAFFEALDLIRSRKQYQNGLQKLKSLPESSPDQKSFMKHHSLKQKHNNPLEYMANLKKQFEVIINFFLKALREAENNFQSTANYSSEQIKESEKFIEQINAYIEQGRTQIFFNTAVSKKILKHSNSHIIAMNIAHLLFAVQKTKQSFFFLQLALQKAVSQRQLQRVGMALNLLGRYYFLEENGKWEETYLNLLKHCKTYPKYVVKQALSTYGGLLFQKGRFCQAQNYINQALSIESESGLEGLILPSYDFSF